jgi:hypothetical protein
MYEKWLAICPRHKNGDGREECTVSWESDVFNIFLKCDWQDRCKELKEELQETLVHCHPPIAFLSVTVGRDLDTNRRLDAPEHFTP